MTKVFYISLIVLAFFSCKKKNTHKEGDSIHVENTDTNRYCVYFQRSPIVSYTAPTTGVINQAITYSLSSSFTCGNSQPFSAPDSVVGNTRYVKVIGKYYGCICLTSAPVYTHQYSFSTSTPGKYYIKFLKYNNYLTDSIVVN